MSPSGRFTPERSDWAQAALVAAALFALYALSSPRSVGSEDDGLFVLSSYFLGIEHPPGYPLFTLLAHPFTWLPFGSIAYRVHLASAFFGALSAAALWLCARSLVPGRAPAYLAALGLGASPVFWSQAIIAEVYTLNTFLFLVLVYLGVRACPPCAPGQPAGAQGRGLPWMALVFGLSLSNHYPLMLLAAPAFAVLLWPLRAELLKRAGALLALVAVGLLPYLWLVRRSWDPLPISFYGPLETLPEIWFFISRAGYAGVDQSVSADWLDRIRFFQFLGGQLLLQFAVVGTLLAGAGFAVQWRILGHRVAAFLTVAFVMPSVVLILLLGFDYSTVSKQVFHVYPLPAYAVGALWMALGFAWLGRRMALGVRPTAAGAAILVLLVLAVGVRQNLLADHDWIARYARTLLKTLPADAIVFGKGDPDLVPMAYLHIVENERPDLTLFHAEGLILGNRLFYPLRTDKETGQSLVRKFIAEQTVPVTFTLQSVYPHAVRDRGLYAELDRSSGDPKAVTVDIPEEALQFYEKHVLGAVHPNGWVAFIQGELRRRYGVLLARSMPRDRPPEERTRRHFERLAQDFYGALGLAEGLMLNPAGYSVGAVGELLDRVRQFMPSDPTKDLLSRYFYLRGAVRANMRDSAGAIADFETAFSIWPTPENAAVHPLEDLYRKSGNDAALKALRDRVAELKRTKRD
jgi:hypothetical protein